MTKEFKKLTELLRFAVFGERVDEKDSADMEQVCQIALKQGVLPLAFAAFEDEEKKKLNPKWKAYFLSAVLKNEQKMAALSAIIKKLKENGIEYCILKGSTVAAEYHLSEYRFSGDIDLYVNPEEELRTAEILKEMGLAVVPRLEGKHDFQAKSPASGLIEVHIQLYADKFRKVVLKERFGISEPFRAVAVNENMWVNALGHNDMLEFLTTHLIKHFVREGCGIRQITDLLAYVKNHRDDIDFDKYFEKLEDLKFKKLILNVFGIGVKYFGLELEEYSLEYADRLLDDIEEGENFGFGDSERRGFFENFIISRESEKSRTVNELAGKKKKAVLKSVFLPNREFLIKKGYGYLRRSGLLYPIAYFHRLFDLFLSLIRGKKSVHRAMTFGTEENEKVQKRLEMMKELDVF